MWVYRYSSAYNHCVKMSEEGGFSYEIIPVEAGDVTYDGTVNAQDALRLLAYISGDVGYIEDSVADVTEDGKVNNEDVLQILQFVAGWDVTLE